MRYNKIIRLIAEKDKKAPFFYLARDETSVKGRYCIQSILKKEE